MAQILSFRNRNQEAPRSLSALILALGSPQFWRYLPFLCAINAKSKMAAGYVHAQMTLQLPIGRNNDFPKGTKNTGT
ncbi:hypothetical protein FKM82_002566 [Ascaphus truei]